MSTNSEIPEKMDLHSLDVSEENRTNLKQLLPSVFTETYDEKGELVESIDFEKLRAELGTFSDVFEARRERYGMDWPGKKEALKLIQQSSVATLKPCREESINFDTTGNLFIEGDNLEVLKLLQKSYYGKVKMIYIDPPYNTGEQFIYPDDYAESLETYLAYAGLVDDEGKKFSTNTPNEGRFHTRWLNMMYPRLYLARNLLKEAGVIFISIDDNEVENLRRICNEIFGEENFIAELVWEKGRKNDAKLFSVGHEYCLVYARSLSKLKEEKTVWREPKPGASEIWAKYLDLKSKYIDDYNGMQVELRSWYKSLPNDHPSKKLTRYKHIDQYGPWRDTDISWPGGGGPRYDVIHPKTSQPCKVPDRGWRFSTPESMERQIQLGLVVFRDTHEDPPISKSHLRPLSDELNEADVLDGFNNGDIDDSEVGSQVMPSVIYKQSQVAVKYLNKLFGAKVFDNPKDHEVLKRFIRYVTDERDIVMDFFAGSGPIGQAVLELNAVDNYSLKFVLVQLPEPCNEKSEAYQAGYTTVAEICKERIRKVIKIIHEEREAKAKKNDGKLPGMTEEQSELDLGFRVFKLNRSSFRIWDGSNLNASEEEIAQQLEMHIDHIDSTATHEDILFELLLKAGFMSTEKVEKLELAGKTVISIAAGALLICLVDEITRQLIDAVAEADPLQFICLDRGFSGNDQLKANAAQTFSARNQGRDKAEQIVFRTV